MDKVGVQAIVTRRAALRDEHALVALAGPGLRQKTRSLLAEPCMAVSVCRERSD